MSLQSRLNSLIVAVGADIKSLQTQINGLSGGGGAPYWTEQRLTTDWTNTTVTATSIFTGFAPDINSLYEVEFLLIASTAATTNGFQFALDGANTSIASFAVQLMNATAAGATAFVNPGSWGSMSGATAGMTTTHLQWGKGLFWTNATAPASNVRPIGRAEVAGSEVRARAGSLFKYRKVA